MDNKLARKLQNFISKTESDSYPEMYIIHYIDLNDVCYNVKSIEYVAEENGYVFEFDDKDMTHMWSELVNEDYIYVYKLSKWY